MSTLRIGTCSWKFPSWDGLVYSSARDINFLEEYARRYRTVEIDQWFWSLFDTDSIALPRAVDGTDVYVNVNNHYEGSAPLTIEKLERLIDERRERFSQMR